MAIGRRGLLLLGPPAVGVVAILLAAAFADTRLLVAVTGLAVLAAVASVGAAVVLGERRVRTAIDHVPARAATRVTRALPAAAPVPAADPVDEVAIADRLLHRLDKLVRREYRQLEELLSLYHEVAPAGGLPPLRGWAASPDYLRALYAEVREQRPRAVVECGSGTSTLIVARALQANGHGHLVSLEHLAEHAAATRELLVEAGCDDVVTVVHAPLVDHTIGAATFTWYDLAAAGPLGEVDLVAVDGPPKAVGPLARYPALPLLVDVLDPAARLLLDDADRPDELAALRRWSDEEPGLRWTRLGGEKGTVLVQRGQ